MAKLKKIAVLFIAGLVFVSMIQPAVASKSKININTATKKELVTLKHVGDKLADRIIEYREAHPFKSIEEIMQVKGIGQKVFDANKDVITVQKE